MRLSLSWAFSQPAWVWCSACEITSLSPFSLLPCSPLLGMVVFCLQWCGVQHCQCLASMNVGVLQMVAQLPCAVVVVAICPRWPQSAVDNLCMDLSGLTVLSHLSCAKGKQQMTTHQEYLMHVLFLVFARHGRDEPRPMGPFRKQAIAARCHEYQPSPFCGSP